MSLILPPPVECPRECSCTDCSAPARDPGADLPWQTAYDHPRDEMLPPPPPTARRGWWRRVAPREVQS